MAGCKASKAGWVKPAVFLLQPTAGVSKSFRRVGGRVGCPLVSPDAVVGRGAVSRPASGRLSRFAGVCAVSGDARSAAGGRSDPVLSPRLYFLPR